MELESDSNSIRILKIPRTKRTLSVVALNSLSVSVLSFMLSSGIHSYGKVVLYRSQVDAKHYAIMHFLSERNNKETKRSMSEPSSSFTFEALSDETDNLLPTEMVEHSRHLFPRTSCGFSKLFKIIALIEDHVDPDVKDDGIKDEPTTSKQKCSSSRILNALALLHIGYRMRVHLHVIYDASPPVSRKVINSFLNASELTMKATVFILIGFCAIDYMRKDYSKMLQNWMLNVYSDEDGQTDDELGRQTLTRPTRIESNFETKMDREEEKNGKLLNPNGLDMS
ncbi:hypothetical protein Tco_0278391 [Tanacetum coccineum]